MAKTREEIRAHLFPRQDYAIAIKIANLDDIPYTPTKNLPTGSIVVLANRVLVANRNLVVGYEGSLTGAGVFWFPKLTGPGTAVDRDTSRERDAGLQRRGSPEGGRCRDRGRGRRRQNPRYPGRLTCRIDR